MANYITVCAARSEARFGIDYLVWANVSWFEKGKRQYHDFQSLRIKNRRAHTNDVLVQAARNTGCIPMED